MKKFIINALTTMFIASTICPMAAFAEEQETQENYDIGTALVMYYNEFDYPVTGDFWVRGRDTDVHYELDMTAKFVIEDTGKVTYTLYANKDFAYDAEVYCHVDVKTNPINVTYKAPDWCAYGKNLDAENRNGWHMVDTNCTYKYGHGDEKPVETFWITAFDLKPTETFDVSVGEVIGVWSMSPATPVRIDENGNYMTTNADRTARNIADDEVEVVIDNKNLTAIVKASLGTSYNTATSNADDTIEAVDTMVTYAQPNIAANIKFGDVNDDGAVSVSDLVLMKKYITTGDDIINVAAADMNNDGTVNDADFDILTDTLIQK